MQFVIAHYSSPHYQDEMHHCALAGYWNVDAEGQAMSTEMFAWDCLSNACDFFTYLDAALLHQRQPDQALMNSTAINCFRNALTLEQWAKVKDHAQCNLFNSIKNVDQLVLCTKNIQPQKKLVPRPGGKAAPTKPAGPSPTLATTTEAHIHVMDSNAHTTATKRSAPTDKGERQNTKKAKGKSTWNQPYRPFMPPSAISVDRKVTPPRGASTAATLQHASKLLLRTTTATATTIQVTVTTGVVMTPDAGVIAATTATTKTIRAINIVG
ncbi:hypothetical protein M427DRAFT_28838 [Gonapodya prolifera JEL478]|uniref:Uncharacterized protein n=1 Tax=Gonapodya prolifera (strain JEL478) TaxID=1344416 RepID=A0A139ARG6_GONPJ|nr:hypothetical protein M427DRAFT_28838 [Gonapodya prolifera JEL478]|eukprot:KXS19351.1 hypothetical protein M427DRAFT_28838 [Gonapodya prolifera JEL478]